jgi:hypothetical protein
MAGASFTITPVHRSRRPERPIKPCNLLRPLVDFATGNAWLEVGKKFLAANNSRLQVIESGKFSGLWQRNWAGTIFTYELLPAGLILSQRYSLAHWATIGRPTTRLPVARPRVVEVVTPGLFTWNSDRTVTLNTGIFHAGDFTPTVADSPGDAVGVREPTSLILLRIRRTRTWRTAPSQS